MKKLTTEQFIEKAKEIHGNKYDYLLTEYKNNKTKIKIICSEHGEFEQIPLTHLKGQGCKKCGSQSSGLLRKLTTEDFIEKARLVHGDNYDYSLVEYMNSSSKVVIICPVHGEFEQECNSHLMGSGCSKCVGLKKLTTEDFIEKARLVHGNNYDYSLIEYMNSISKVVIICSIHGEFEQIPSNHLSGQGCEICGGKKTLDKRIFINRSINIHGNKYVYSLVEYVNNKTKVKIICPEHGEFEQTPNRHLVGDGCPICKESKGEKEIRKYLIENGLVFISQHKFHDCKNKRTLPFDFYLPDYNTCIEFDGRQHYLPIKYFGGLKGLEETKIRDEIKNKYCQDNIIKLIRIKYNENIFEKLNKNLKCLMI